MTKHKQLAILLPFIAVVVIVAIAVLWHLWFSYTGRPAFLLEALRTVCLLWFMLYAIQRTNYRDVYLASIPCLVTDVAWLVRLLHFHNLFGFRF